MKVWPEVTCRPLGLWASKPTHPRVHSPFKAGWTGTMHTLQYEVQELGGDHLFMEIDLQPSQIRVDGKPRASAVPATPAVVVAFNSDHGSMRYPCDRFRYWQDNVRAIALTLARLRAVGRYGVTGDGLQYTGWRQLAPAGGSDDGARSLIAHYAGVPDTCMDRTTIEEDARTHFRKALKTAHPDTGGSESDLEAVMQAGRRIGLVR